MKKQKMILISLITVTMILVLMPTSNAALQSNGSVPTTQVIDSWIVNIRKMEGVGGTLGLTETLNSDLTSSSGSNNLDIHMQKNTEYGAIAILSASSYGNPNKITSGGTTTGNETGIVMNLNKEWVAAGQLMYATNFTNANARYKNSYTTSYVAKKGDAISETANWHGSGASIWLSSEMSGSGTSHGYATCTAGLLRSYSGSIFSYYGYCNRATAHNMAQQSSAWADAYYRKTWYSRAIMICGEGI